MEGTGYTAGTPACHSVLGQVGRKTLEIILKFLLSRVAAETSFGVTEAGTEHSFTTSSLQGERGERTLQISQQRIATLGLRKQHYFFSYSTFWLKGKV